MNCSIRKWSWTDAAKLAANLGILWNIKGGQKRFRDRKAKGTD